jgi:hypothetical protein
MDKKPKVKTYKEDLEELTQKELRNIRQKIKMYIENATLSLIGLEKRGSDYEIDHCNGRSSVLTEAFKTIAREEATKIAKTYKPTKEDITGFQEAFKKELKNQMSYALRDEAKIKATELAKEMFSKTKIDIDKILSTEIGEINSITF